MLRATTRAVALRPASLVARRAASSHHHHPEDTTVYPNEGFGAPIWRKTLVAVVAAGLFYEYFGAPSDSDKPWVLEPTKSALVPLVEDGETLRAAREIRLVEERTLVRSATRPAMYRTRNPEDFNMVSTFRVPIGMRVEWIDTKP